MDVCGRGVETRKYCKSQIHQRGWISNIAAACKKIECKMIYISTDYVLHGQGDTPWNPDCEAYAPLNVYGQSKLDRELAANSTLDKFFIIRIAWVFGVNGNNFIKTMLNLSKSMTPFVWYRIRWARQLTLLIWPDCWWIWVYLKKYGYYHATNEGEYISRYEFDCEIFRQGGVNMNVTPVTTDEYGLSKAARPYDSRLDKSKLNKKWVYAPAHMAGRAGEISERNWSEIIWDRSKSPKHILMGCASSNRLSMAIPEAISWKRTISEIWQRSE